MLDVTQPVQTSDGRKARIICSDRKVSEWPIVALVEANGAETVFLAQPDGTGHGVTKLINVPRTIKRWVVMWIAETGTEHSLSSGSQDDVQKDLAEFRKQGLKACVVEVEGTPT